MKYTVEQDPMIPLPDGAGGYVIVSKIGGVTHIHCTAFQKEYADDLCFLLNWAARERSIIEARLDLRGLNPEGRTNAQDAMLAESIRRQEEIEKTGTYTKNPFYKD